MVWSFFISGCCVIRKLTRVGGGYSRETTAQNLLPIMDKNTPWYYMTNVWCTILRDFHRINENALGFSDWFSWFGFVAQSLWSYQIGFTQENLRNTNPELWAKLLNTLLHAPHILKRKTESIGYWIIPNWMLSRRQEETYCFQTFIPSFWTNHLKIARLNERLLCFTICFVV